MPAQKFIVRPGDTFGRLTVIELVKRRLPSGQSRTAARCTCECGAEVEVLTQNLKNRTRSCGCLKKRGTMSDEFRTARRRPRLFTVTAGDKFDRLTVLSEEQIKTPAGQLKWVALCSCDCGAQVSVHVSNLKHGNTRSCGCLQREHAARIGKSMTSHGLTNHPHYARWNNMRKRCDDPSDTHYQYYGGRGIRVHEAWYDAQEFISYLENVLGPCPVGHSLDRVDNDGNYEPGNLRWADPITQRHNQRRGTSWSSPKTPES